MRHINPLRILEALILVVLVFGLVVWWTLRD